MDFENKMNKTGKYTNFSIFHLMSLDFCHFLKCPRSTTLKQLYMLFDQLYVQLINFQHYFFFLDLFVFRG